MQRMYVSLLFQNDLLSSAVMLHESTRAVSKLTAVLHRGGTGHPGICDVGPEHSAGVIVFLANSTGRLTAECERAALCRRSLAALPDGHFI